MFHTFGEITFCPSRLWSKFAPLLKPFSDSEGIEMVFVYLKIRSQRIVVSLYCLLMKRITTNSEQSVFFYQQESSIYVLLSTLDYCFNHTLTISRAIFHYIIVMSHES